MMLGWISVLGMFASISGVAMAFGAPLPAHSAKAATVVCSALFCLAVAATQLRNRA